MIDTKRWLREATAKLARTPGGPDILAARLREACRDIDRLVAEQDRMLAEARREVVDAIVAEHLKFKQALRHAEFDEADIRGAMSAGPDRKIAL